MCNFCLDCLSVCLISIQSPNWAPPPPRVKHKGRDGQQWTTNGFLIVFLRFWSLRPLLPLEIELGYDAEGPLLLLEIELNYNAEERNMRWRH